MQTKIKYIYLFFSSTIKIALIVIFTVIFMNLVSIDFLNKSEPTYLVESKIKKSSLIPLFEFAEFNQSNNHTKDDLQKYYKLFDTAINYIKSELSTTQNNYFNFDEIEEKEISESDDFSVKSAPLLKTSNTVIEIKPKVSIQLTSVKPIVVPVKRTPIISSMNKPNQSIEQPDTSEIENNNQKNSISETNEYDNLESIPLDEDLISTLDDNSEQQSIKVEQEVYTLTVENEESIIIIDPSDDDLLVSSFTKNPCYSEAARYIARCTRFRHLNRK